MGGRGGWKGVQKERPYSVGRLHATGWHACDVDSSAAGVLCALCRRSLPARMHVLSL